MDLGSFIYQDNNLGEKKTPELTFLGVNSGVNLATT